MGHDYLPHPIDFGQYNTLTFNARINSSSLDASSSYMYSMCYVPTFENDRDVIGGAKKKRARLGRVLNAKRKSPTVVEFLWVVVIQVGQQIPDEKSK